MLTITSTHAHPPGKGKPGSNEDTGSSSGKSTSTRKPKVARRWDQLPSVSNEPDDVNLDYGGDADQQAGGAAAAEADVLRLQEQFGQVPESGDYMDAHDDSDDGEDDDDDGLITSDGEEDGKLDEADEAKSQQPLKQRRAKRRQLKKSSSGSAASPSSSSAASSAGNRIFGFFKSLTGNAVLTRETLQPAVEKIRETLMAKNVAQSIADNLCESVMNSLEGTKQQGFTTIRTIVQQVRRLGFCFFVCSGCLLCVLQTGHARCVLSSNHQAL